MGVTYSLLYENDQPGKERSIFWSVCTILLTDSLPFSSSFFPFIFCAACLDCPFNTFLNSACACLDCPFNTFLNSACAWLKWFCFHTKNCNLSEKYMMLADE